MIDIDEVSDLIKALVKAKKNLRMYPVNHPVYEKTIDDFWAKMVPLSETDTVRIRINQYDILYNDEVIYHCRDREESLALFFFKDGLRELSFLRGITRGELKEFLKIISLDFETDMLDDDIVTLLWERDFEHIKYIVDDTFLMEDESYVTKAVEEAKSVSGQSANIMKAYESANNAESTHRTEIMPLTKDDIDTVIKIIENDPPDKSHVLIRILFEMNFIAQKKEEYEVINRCIKQTLEYAMSNARLDIVNYVLAKIIDNQKKPVYPEQAWAYLKNIENYINSAVFIKVFGTTVRSGAAVPHESLTEFSSLLNINSIPHLISVLGDMEDISSRKTVISVLTEVGRKDVALVANGLNDKRWYVVRNIVYVLRHIGDRSSVQYLVKVAGHPDKRVRKEVLHAVGEMGSDEVLHILKEHISDEAASVRIAAFKALGAVGTPSARQVILDLAGSKKIRDRSFAEKKEIFQVLVRWKEKEVIDFLVRMARRIAIFGRTKNNETRAAAIHCLGMISADNVRQIAERYKKSGNDLLRKQALEILRNC